MEYGCRHDAVTAMQVQQVGTGILPGVALDTAAADALTANELTLQDSEKHTKAERTAFVMVHWPRWGRRSKTTPSLPPRDRLPRYGGGGA